MTLPGGLLLGTVDGALDEEARTEEEVAVVVNMRRLSELPHALLGAGERQRLVDRLSDIRTFKLYVPSSCFVARPARRLPAPACSLSAECCCPLPTFLRLCFFCRVTQPARAKLAQAPASFART
jgi:hypothetical protein